MVIYVGFPLIYDGIIRGFQHLQGSAGEDSIGFAVFVEDNVILRDLICDDSVNGRASVIFLLNNSRIIIHNISGTACQVELAGTMVYVFIRC